VTRTFAGIFRREGVKAAIIEGDSFHRYDRQEMKVRQAQAEKEGNKHFSHFGVDNNLFGEIENLFKAYGQTGQGRARKYLHNAEEAEPFKQEPGTFTPWEELPEGTDILFYEGLHGALVTPEHNIAQYPDLRQRQILHYRQMRKQLEVLEYHANPGTQCRQISLRVVQRDAINKQITLLKRFERVKSLDQRRLA
jgi:phosphoribulokinase